MSQELIIEKDEDLIELTEDMLVSEGEITEIKGINFILFSAEEIRRLSTVEVKESKLSGEGSVYDPRFGVILNHRNCVTCKKSNKDCPGHCGHIELPVPIPHPMYPEEILNYLNCHCCECSSLLIEVDDMNLLNMFKLKGSNRFRCILDYCNKVKSCPKCEEDKYTFYVNEYKYYKYLKNKIDKVPVTSSEIENILGNIKKSDVKLIGFNNEEIVPVNLIITVLLVLPICARPFVETNRGPCDDDLTSKYIDIVKACNKLRNTTKIQKEKDRNEIIETLEFHIRTLMYNYKQKARQINNRPIKCIRERMNGKDGLFRNNLSGKRGDFTARTVIGPDPRLRADEIALPEEFCTKLTFPEIVNKINIKQMEELVNNGKANYVKRKNILPGEDEGKTEYKTYDLKYNLNTRATYETGGFSLEEGDIILRDGKKIDPVKFKSTVGKDITLLATDKVARKGKILKNFKQSEKVTFELESTDKIYRNGIYINAEQIRLNKGNFELKNKDRVFRNGTELKNILMSQKRYFNLKIGDIVERHLRDGDIVLFGRQPTQL
jgi:DNA-directed RNA polymerase beta' subunit